jgi:hypothetical protein
VAVTDTDLPYVRIAFEFVGPKGPKYNILGSCGYTNAWTCGAVQFDAWSAVGDWKLSKLTATDANGNEHNALAAFPIVITLTGTPDNDPPVASAFRFSPATLDVTLTAGVYSHQQITGWINCTDMLSGCASVDVSLLPPPGSPTSAHTRVGFEAPGRVAVAGMVQMTSVTSDAFATPWKYVSGAFIIDSIVAYDASGNRRSYFGAELAAIAINGLSLQVNQPAAPTAKLYNIVSYVHAPVSVNIKGVTAVAVVQANVTVEGITPMTGVTVYAYLQHATKPVFSVKFDTMVRTEVVGGNTVYSQIRTYTDFFLLDGTYNLVGAMTIEDQYESKNIYGNCPYTTPIAGLTLDDCTDFRRDLLVGSAVAHQVSIFVLIAAVASTMLFA